MRKLSVALASVLAAAGLLTVALPANAAPAGHPVRCDISADPPNGPDAFGFVHYQAKIQCSEPMKRMNGKLSIKGPNGAARSDEDYNDRAPTQLILSSKIPYAGKGQYDVTFWGMAFPSPGQDNGLDSSAMNFAVL